VVEQQGKVVGVVPRTTALEFLAHNGATATVGQLVENSFEAVAEDTTLLDVVSNMRSHHVSMFLVASVGMLVAVQNVKGVISKERIAEAMTETVSLSRE
jgi:predicted transcriptional regulator